MPAGFHVCVASECDGLVYLLGYGDTASPPQHEVHAYDPATDAYAEQPALPVDQPVFQDAVSVNGRLYFSGDGLYEYDPAAGTADLLDVVGVPYELCRLGSRVVGLSFHTAQ